jgi:hypothetical protein
MRALSSSPGIIGNSRRLCGSGTIGVAMPAIITNVTRIIDKYLTAFISFLPNIVE